MARSAMDFPLTPRERLRLRRALDMRLIDDIFGRAIRDDVAMSPIPSLPLPPLASLGATVPSATV